MDDVIGRRIPEAGGGRASIEIGQRILDVGAGDDREIHSPQSAPAASRRKPASYILI